MKKIIVIGGGFAGSLAAQKLEKEYDVTLIDSKDYFEYTPGILRTIVEPGHIRKVQVLHSHYLKRTTLIKKVVKEITRKHVIIGTKKLPYDYLIISSGSTYGLPIKDQRVVMAARATNLRTHAKKLEQAKKVLIIGGGIVGVELAAEINNNYPNKKITLIHSRNNLMNKNHPKAIAYVEKQLQKRGIGIILNKRVDPEHLPKWATQKKYDMIFICTGITPNFDFMKKNFKSKLQGKQILTDPCLRLQGTPNIFVAGDVSNLKEEKTAQNAEAHANTIVKSIHCIEKGKKPIIYKTKIRPMVISLGPWDGIFEYKNIIIKGILPGILKHFIEWKVMRTKR